MAKDFEKYVETHSGATPPMPLMHVTDGYAFRAILRSGGVKPTKCQVLKQSVVYFSYGRPAYNPNKNLAANGFLFYAPICLIFDSQHIKVDKVFPFDTGAFHAGLLQDSFHKSMKRDDYELSGHHSTPPKIVSAFFKTNRDYFLGQPREDIDNTKVAFEVEAFLTLVKDKKTNQYDDRVYTIELVSTFSSSLKGKLKAVVLPQQMLDKDEFRSELAALGCTPLPYMYAARQAGLTYKGAMAERVFDFLRNQGSIV